MVSDRQCETLLRRVANELTVPLDSYRCFGVLLLIQSEIGAYAVPEDTMADSSSPPLSSYIMDEETLKRKQKEKLKKLMATGGNPRPARSLLFLTLRNPFRKACISIVEWKYPVHCFYIWSHLCTVVSRCYVWCPVCRKAVRRMSVWSVYLQF